jgi:hypothetical protein
MSAPQEAEQVRTLIVDHVLWTVRLRANDHTFRSVGHDLVFESDHAVRRVRSYPDHWFDLSDSELSAVSWGR